MQRFDRSKTQYISLTYIFDTLSIKYFHISIKGDHSSNNIGGPSQCIGPYTDGYGRRLGGWHRAILRQTEGKLWYNYC